MHQHLCVKKKVIILKHANRQWKCKQEVLAVLSLAGSILITALTCNQTANEDLVNCIQ